MSELTADAGFLGTAPADEAAARPAAPVGGESSAGSSHTVWPLPMLYQYLRPSGRTCSSQFYAHTRYRRACQAEPPPTWRTVDTGGKMTNAIKAFPGFPSILQRGVRRDWGQGLWQAQRGLGGLAKG